MKKMSTPFSPLLPKIVPTSPQGRSNKGWTGTAVPTLPTRSSHPSSSHSEKRESGGMRDQTQEGGTRFCRT
jgi:hypothetical protein